MIRDETVAGDNEVKGIPAVFMRGGTSKGVFLHAKDVPQPGPELDNLLLHIMGSPDPLQIDGMGGTFSSTSKVVIVEPTANDVVTYWFAQIGIDRAIVDWSGNCGNLTTAVAPFAIDERLVAPTGPVTRMRLVNGNTGVVIEAEVEVDRGQAKTTGDLAIGGVPGTGSPVVTRYLDPSGGVLGALLPTGSPVDLIETDAARYEVSIVDAAHPYVFVAAKQLGLTGDPRTPAELNTDDGLLAEVESVRAASSVLVGAATSVEDARGSAPATPRIIVVDSDAGDADLRLTAFSMGAVHRALPMTGALCAAAAVFIDGTVVAASARRATGHVRLRHPKGIASVIVETQPGPQPIRSLGIVRTARRLMSGLVYPRDV